MLTACGGSAPGRTSVGHIYSSVVYSSVAGETVVPVADTRKRVTAHESRHPSGRPAWEGMPAARLRAARSSLRSPGPGRDHVQDEESEQFPSFQASKLREAIPCDQMLALADGVRAAKKAAPTRPHPSAPNSELFHKSVGPGVGLIDRLRDKLTSLSTS